MTFSQEFIRRGETCYTNIVVSLLILKMRSEDTVRFLRNDSAFIAFSLGYTSYQADNEVAEHFVCHRGPSTKDSEKNGYICMLIDSEVYSIVTYFWETNSMVIVTTGACAVVTKTTILILCNCYRTYLPDFEDI